MEKYKIVVFLTHHEDKNSLIDTINNIFRFNDSVCIFINDGSNDDLNNLGEHVYVVKRKQQYRKFDTMIALHIDLCDAMLQNNICSDIVLILASNQLFVNHDFYSFAKNFKGSFYDRPVDGRCIHKLNQFPQFSYYYLQLFGSENFIHQTNADGMFFQYDDFVHMMRTLNLFRDFVVPDHAEEFLYIAYLIKKYGKNNLTSFDSYNVWPKDWCYNSNTISIEEIYNARNNGKFLVKRVARDYNDASRKYIRENLT